MSEKAKGSMARIILLTRNVEQQKVGMLASGEAAKQKLALHGVDCLMASCVSDGNCIPGFGPSLCEVESHRFVPGVPGCSADVSSYPSSRVSSCRYIQVGHVTMQQLHLATVFSKPLSAATFRSRYCSKEMPCRACNPSSAEAFNPLPNSP